MSEQRPDWCTPRHTKRYPSKAAALDGALTAKVNAALNGNAKDKDRQPEFCDLCTGWHITTKGTRAARRRNRS